MSGCSIWLTSFRLSQALYVAARLEIAGLLADEPKSAEDLAKATGAHAPSLARLLRTLVAFDLLREAESGLFGLAPKGIYLQADHPESIRDAILWFVGEDAWRTWADLLWCVQTGESATSHLFGVANPFPRYAQHPELNALANAGFVAFGRVRADAAVAAYDFSSSGSLVDVGGGQGQLVTTILRAYPAVHGVLFDQPHVVAGAEWVADAAGVADRLQIVAGDMFSEVPAGGDTYMLMNVIHDWDDTQALAILKNCHRAMRQQTTLLLIEQMLPSSIAPSQATQTQTIADLNMLVRTTGHERTEEEFRALLSAAGFELDSVVTTQTAHSLLTLRRG